MENDNLDLAAFSEFIDDADKHHSVSPEVVACLRQIFDITTAFQSRLQDATDTDNDDLENYLRDGTYSHHIGVEWQNINMGIRYIVLRLRNRVERLFGLMLEVDEVTELHIGLQPHPYFTVGRSRIAFADDSWGAESSVREAHDKLGLENVECENLESFSDIIRRIQNPLVVVVHLLTLMVAVFNPWAVKKKGETMVWMLAKNRTPMELLKEFVESLEKSADQLGVDVKSGV